MNIYKHEQRRATDRAKPRGDTVVGMVMFAMIVACTFYEVMTVCPWQGRSVISMAGYLGWFMFAYHDTELENWLASAIVSALGWFGFIAFLTWFVPFVWRTW